MRLTEEEIAKIGIIGTDDSITCLKEGQTNTIIVAKSNIDNEKITAGFNGCNIEYKDESHEVVLKNNNEFQKMILQERHEFLARMQCHSFKSNIFRIKENNRSKIEIKKSNINDRTFNVFEKTENASSPLLLKILDPENLSTSMEVINFFSNLIFQFSFLTVSFYIFFSFCFFMHSFFINFFIHCFISILSEHLLSIYH